MRAEQTRGFCGKWLIRLDDGDVLRDWSVVPGGGGGRSGTAKTWDTIEDCKAAIAEIREKESPQRPRKRAK